MYSDKILLFPVKKDPNSRNEFRSKIQQDLPNYDDPTLSEMIIPENFSYPVGNMGDKTCLNLLSADRNLRISIDAVLPYHRNNPEAPRFYLQERNEKGEYKTMVTSDDWKEILFCIQYWGK